LCVHVVAPTLNPLFLSFYSFFWLLPPEFTVAAEIDLHRILAVVCYERVPDLEQWPCLLNMNNVCQPR
jgi:hypothetical protein